jgi:hypothetical protein
MSRMARDGEGHDKVVAVDRENQHKQTTNQITVAL